MIYFKRHIKWGDITVALDDDANIAGLWFQNQKYFPDISEDELWLEDICQDAGGSKESRVRVDKQREAMKRFDLQIKEYQEGKRKEFDLPLAPQGSEFRKLVWKELLEIPMGATTTYGELGKKVAKIKGKETMSAQAIGGAVGHNPISLIIPCHRVVGAKGQLTGYAGGVDKKVAILEHEGVEI